MKLAKSLVHMVCTVVISALVAGVVYMWLNNVPAVRIQDRTIFDVTVLEELMEENNELSTVTYSYADCYVVTDKNVVKLGKFGNVTMPFTTAIYEYEFDAVIKAGYDLDSADVRLVGANTVVVVLPSAEILSHETTDVRLVWEQQNIFNPLHAGQEHEWINEAKAQLEERAIDRGLFDEARQNAEDSLEKLFGSALPDDFVLEVRFR